MKKGIAKCLLFVLFLSAVISHAPLSANAASAPTNLTWTGPGQFSFYAPNAADTRYFVEVYCDGVRMTRYDAGVCIEGTVSRDIRFVMDTAGTYTFRVKAAENNADNDFSYGAVSAFSEGYWLAPASSKLSNPSDLRWSGTKEGLAVWNRVDGAAKYHVVLYDNGTPVRGLLTFDDVYTQENLLPYMSSGAGHSYTFSVMAVSANPGETGNSNLSYSGAYAGTVNGGAVSSGVQDERVPFKDVMRDQYYSDAVVWAYNTGIFTGYSEERFGIDDACTRAQIVTLLHRINHFPQPSDFRIRFSDVQGTSYYCIPVLWATERGITKGVSDTLFAPDQGCTRGQIVTLLWRMDGAASSFPDGTKFWVPFADVPEDAYYRTAVGWARSNNFINGYGDTFVPEGYCTRAQVAVILYRMYGGGK